MASRIPRLWHSRPAFKTILANTRSYSSVDASFEPPVSRLRDRIKSYWPAFLAWTVFGSEALHLLWLRQDYKNYKEKTTTRISILNDVITKMENGQHVDLENALYIGDFRERSSSTPIDTVDYSSAADDKDWIKRRSLSSFSFPRLTLFQSLIKPQKTTKYNTRRPLLHFNHLNLRLPFTLHQRLPLTLLQCLLPPHHHLLLQLLLPRPLPDNTQTLQNSINPARTTFTVKFYSFHMQHFAS